MESELILHGRLKGVTKNAVVILVEAWQGAWYDLAIDRDKWKWFMGDVKDGDEFTVTITKKQPAPSDGAKGDCDEQGTAA